MSHSGMPDQIVLHVGLPKAGSTALQHYCNTNRTTLRAHGVDYPEVLLNTQGTPLTNDATPKHQTLINALRSGDVEPVRVLVAGSQQPMLLLSSEGLSNHFHTFAPEHLAALRSIFAPSRVTLFMVVRERESWLRSLWKESILSNAQTDEPFETYASRPGVQRLADWEGLRDRLISSYGAEEACVANVEDDWRRALHQHIGVPQSDDFVAPKSSYNVSVSDEILGFIRHFNRLKAGPMVKLAVFYLLQRHFNTSNVWLQNAYAWRRPSREKLTEAQDLLGPLTLEPAPVSDVAERVLKVAEAMLQE